MFSRVVVDRDRREDGDDGRRRARGRVMARWLSRVESPHPPSHCLRIETLTDHDSSYKYIDWNTYHYIPLYGTRLVFTCPVFPHVPSSHSYAITSQSHRRTNRTWIREPRPLNPKPYPARDSDGKGSIDRSIVRHWSSLSRRAFTVNASPDDGDAQRPLSRVRVRGETEPEDDERE